MNVKGLLIAPLLVATMAGCSAKTHLTSTDPNVRVAINDRTPVNLSITANRTYKTTSFGQYHFHAYQADGKEGAEMYGLMPLKFNPGYLVADILLFAPATFFNLREVFPYYEFDVDAGILRYKQKPNDPWSIYRPTEAEAERARSYFALPR